MERTVDNMRKVTFIINDLKWMRKFYKLSDEQFNDMFKNQKPFKCIYTLYGEGNKSPDRYELTDYDGNNININDLNGYQRGVVLNDCMAYFTGGKYTNNGKEPCGVIEIKEEDIKKFYRVEVVYCAFLKMKSGNSYIDYRPEKPDSTTENLPMKDIHKAWFEDPVEAENYLQKCLSELP